MSVGDLATNLRKLADSHIRALDFVTPAILESVEAENGEPLGVVRMLGDDERLVDKIPLWTYYAGDEYGHEQALHPPERGVLVCLDYPLEEARRDDEPPSDKGLNAGRHHALQDGFFYPTTRLESEAGLNSPTEADWLRHISETERRITETGDYEVEHHAGHRVYVREDEIEVSFARSDGDRMSVTVTEEDVIFDGPDEYKRYQSNPRTRMGVREDGTSRLGGRSELGDADANRVDPTSEDTRAGSPHTYQQVDERVRPTVDPTTETTKNPASATLAGAVNAQGYEVRGQVIERREEHPDPNAPPTDPAYIDLPDGTAEIPNGYTYWKLPEWELYGWKDGAEVSTGVTL